MSHHENHCWSQCASLDENHYTSHRENHCVNHRASRCESHCASLGESHGKSHSEILILSYFKTDNDFHSRYRRRKQTFVEVGYPSISEAQRTNMSSQVQMQTAGRIRSEHFCFLLGCIVFGGISSSYDRYCSLKRSSFACLAPYPTIHHPD